jgi:hypothetical protein
MCTLKRMMQKVQMFGLAQLRQLSTNRHLKETTNLSKSPYASNWGIKELVERLQELEFTIKYTTEEFDRLFIHYWQKKWLLNNIHWQILNILDTRDSSGNFAKMSPSEISYQLAQLFLWGKCSSSSMCKKLKTLVNLGLVVHHKDKTYSLKDGLK